MSNNSLYDIFDNLGIRIAVMGALTILALFLLAETMSVAQSIGRSGVPATDTITVSGDGEATLAPDVARVSFTVDNSALAVADAQAATTKQADAALAFIKERGIAEKDVKTLSYNISPQYSYSNCPPGVFCPNTTPRITGYQVSENIQVTLHDLTKVGTVLGGLGKLGVQNVSGPAFGLDDSTAGYDAARADAISKAKAQAGLLANQLGVRLGKIVNFSESSRGYPYSVAYGMGSAGATMKDSAPSLPPGENTYTASVSITYEIH